MKMHPMRGISFSVAIGKWAKPHIKTGEYMSRICLGFIAFSFWTLDLEEFIKHLADEAKS